MNNVPVRPTWHAIERWNKRFRGQDFVTSWQRAEVVPTPKVLRLGLTPRMGHVYYVDAKSGAIFPVAAGRGGVMEIRTAIRLPGARKP